MQAGISYFTGVQNVSIADGPLVFVAMTTVFTSIFAVFA